MTSYLLIEVVSSKIELSATSFNDIIIINIWRLQFYEWDKTNLIVHNHRFATDVFSWRWQIHLRFVSNSANEKNKTNKQMAFKTVGRWTFIFNMTWLLCHSKAIASCDSHAIKYDLIWAIEYKMKAIALDTHLCRALGYQFCISQCGKVAWIVC